MTKAVLDSSTILAVLNKETGWEKAEQFFFDGIVSSINVAEVLTKIIERGATREDAIETLNLLHLTVIDFNSEQAAKVAELRPLTKHLGLSLGDRCCLALAILQNATAVTADKEWRKLSFCQIEVIR